MEFLEGELLGTRMRRVGRMRAADAVRPACQVAAATQIADDNGIVHRALTPDNGFIVPDGEAMGGMRAKILDFPTSKDPLIPDLPACVSWPGTLASRLCAAQCLGATEGVHG